jgi:septation ring formation regulator EzrA
MHSTPNPKTDPQHVLVARVDEELAHTYEQIAHADEQIARAEEQLSKLEQDAARYPSDDPQTRMNTLRPAVLGNRPSLGWRAIRGFIGLLLAACIGVAAFVSQSSYGDPARQIIARWAPQLILTSSLTPERPGLPAQPGPSTVQVVAAETVLPQPAPLAQTASQNVASTAAPTSPELTQLLQTMARDLANVEQRLEQLKASQEQMASDNAKAVEQLKASQEQITRLIAKASEQNLRSKTTAPPARPIATPTRSKPVPVLPARRPRERAQAPVPLQPDEQ